MLERYGCGGVLVLTGLLAVGLAAAQEPKAPLEVYTCVDGAGRRITSDRPIAECLDREQRVLDRTGAERRRMGPVLTELERAALQEKRKREEHERIRLTEERRRDRALVLRYPDEASHQAERAQALALVDEVSEVARKRIVELAQERKRLDTELEFYQGELSKAPLKLQRQYADNDLAVREQQRFMAAQEQDKRRIGLRYDTELAQLRQLWAAQRAGAERGPGGAAATPAAAPATLVPKAPGP